MNINDQFESKYLKSADLAGRRLKVKISNIVQELVGEKNENKMIIYFEGKKKGMVCNRINAMTIAEQWGPETDNWIGGELELFSTKVPFQGKLTDGLRVLPMPPRQAAPAVQSTPRVMQNARPTYEPNPTAPAMAGDDPFDDDVPF